MCLSVSVTRNSVSQFHAERNVTLELAEKFALMWVVCLNTSNMPETATDDFSSIIFILCDCAENVFRV